MSVRRYDGPHADRVSPGAAWGRRLPALFAALTIALQIAWPLTSGSGRTLVTILVVWCFFLASLSHAWLHRGARWAAVWAVVSLAFGLGIEVLGTRTGLPFGQYAYADDALGWTVAGIPLLIPLAWAMMSYPALLVGRRLSSNRWGTLLVSAWALASWDLFLDPQMVGEGYWTWASASPALPGLPGIPLTNFIGWFIASIVLMVVLLSLLPGQSNRRRTPEGVPATLYLWTWIGGIVANLFFLQRPWVALVGGIAMGLVALPYAIKLTENPQ